MSTRGAIARLTSKEKEEIKFEGVYAHWDNYPSSTGSTLFNLRNGFFKGDTKKMLSLLIDEHPAGWSTINDVDFSITPAFNEKGYEHGEISKTPQRYCHGERHEEANLVTEKNAGNIGCEYIYAFTPDGNTMLVLSSYCKSGEKMIGMFGMGDPNTEWKVIGEIDLNGKEPTTKQWEKIPIKQNKVKKA